MTVVYNPVRNDIGLLIRGKKRNMIVVEEAEGVEGIALFFKGRTKKNWIEIGEF